jgi:hypothetical protein
MRRSLGASRCFAIHPLNTLTYAQSLIWSVKLTDGSYLSSNMISAYSKVLDDNYGWKDKAALH